MCIGIFLIMLYDCFTVSFTKFVFLFLVAKDAFLFLSSFHNTSFCICWWENISWIVTDQMQRGAMNIWRDNVIPFRFIYYYDLSGDLVYDYCLYIDYIPLHPSNTSSIGTHHLYLLCLYQSTNGCLCGGTFEEEEETNCN